MALTRYKIKIKSKELDEMGMTSSFNSKRAFANSNTSDKMKELNIPVGLTVSYGGDYKNEYECIDFNHFMECLSVATEKELLNEFSKTKAG